MIVDGTVMGSWTDDSVEDESEGERVMENGVGYGWETGFADDGVW